MSVKKYIHKEKKNCENKTLYVFNDSPIRSFTVHMAFSYVNEQLSAQRLVNRPVQISSQSWRISSQEISSQVQFSSLFKQVSFNLLKKYKRQRYLWVLNRSFMVLMLYALT